MNRFVGITLTGVFALSAASADAQPKAQPVQKSPAVQPGGYQGGIAQTPWFTNPEIRQQFKLNDQQFNHLNKSYADVYGRYQLGIKDLGKDLNDVQRAQKMGELQQRFNKDFSTSIDKAFTDPQQRQRYDQLYLQYQGYNAFADPQVQEKLKLTPEQRAKLSQTGQEWQKQMDDLSRAYQTDPQGSTKRFNDMRKQSGERINTVLTPEQQKSWQQMTGEPFNFQPSIYFQSSASTKKDVSPPK